MQQRDVERVIRESVIDDYYGLWEIIWALNFDFPNEPASRKRALAESAVRRLVYEGSIEVFRGRSFQGDQRLVDWKELDEWLADPWWEPHGEDEHTRITASPAFRASYGQPIRT